MRYHIFDYITTNDNLLKHLRPGKLRNLNTYDIASHSTLAHRPPNQHGHIFIAVLGDLLYFEVSAKVCIFTYVP